MIEENARLGSLLKYEADKNYCREVVTVTKGQNLKMGNIVAEGTDGKCTGIAAAATALCGVLLQDVDATEADKQAIVVARDVIINAKSLEYPSGATDAQKKAINKLLDARGIVLREEA